MLLILFAQSASHTTMAAHDQHTDDAMMWSDKLDTTHFQRQRECENAKTNDRAK